MRQQEIKHTPEFIKVMDCEATLGLKNHDKQNKEYKIHLRNGLPMEKSAFPMFT
jgi:hypothetical protein